MTEEIHRKTGLAIKRNRFGGTEKTRLMGAQHKQKLTNKQIHKKIQEDGFDISAVTVNIALADIRKKQNLLIKVKSKFKKKTGNNWD